MSKIQKNIVTREGFDTFTKELDELKSKGRLDIANAISVAKGFGDLSENSEYDAAKEAQALLEKRIFELEDFLKNCEIVETVDDDNITIGKFIVLEKLDDGSEFKAKLVGNNEAEPFSMKTSVASPIGKALLGKKIGSVIDVTSPDGDIIRYKVTNVTIS